MPNPLVSMQFVRLLDDRLREVTERPFRELPSMIDTLYRMLPSDSAWEEFYEVGAVPDIPAFSGKLQYLAIAPGYHVRIEPKEFAGGIQAERKLLDDKRYAVLDDRASGLGESAQRTREKYGVEPFAYAFSSAFTFMTNEEGVSLCNDSHTTKSGTSTSTGFDNAGTSAISKTAIQATRLLMRKFRNDISERIVIEPDTLIVPDNLYDAACELVGYSPETGATSQLDSESAQFKINVNYKRFKVIPYLRLDDYDTNNWYMVDSNLMKKFLIWIDRVKPETNTTIDFETFLVKHSIYFRIGWGWINWRWVFGMNVS
jgi:hypothetical protein